VRGLVLRLFVLQQGLVEGMNVRISDDPSNLTERKPSARRIPGNPREARLKVLSDRTHRYGGAVMNQRTISDWDCSIGISSLFWSR
jgi:hypothetical protein